MVDETQRNMPDAWLVNAARTGDSSAFDALYDRYSTQLVQFCARQLGDRDEGADVMQDAFLIASQRLAQLDDPARFRSWLYVIASRESLRRIRARAHAIPVENVAEFEDLDATPEEVALVSDRAKILLAAAHGLEASDRALIEMYLRGLDGQDLAHAVGRQPQAVHVQFHRAKKRLKHALDAMLVAGHGRRACDQLAGVLDGWDGQMTPLIRKRIVRHIEQCQNCDARRRRLVSPEALLGLVPFLAAPAEAREGLLDDLQLASAKQRLADARANRARRARRALGGVAAALLLGGLFAGLEWSPWLDTHGAVAVGREVEPTAAAPASQGARGGADPAASTRVYTPGLPAGSAAGLGAASTRRSTPVAPVTQTERLTNEGRVPAPPAANPPPRVQPPAQAPGTSENPQAPGTPETPGAPPVIVSPPLPGPIEVPPGPGEPPVVTPPVENPPVENPPAENPPDPGDTPPGDTPPGDGGTTTTTTTTTTLPTPPAEPTTTPPTEPPTTPPTTPPQPVDVTATAPVEIPAQPAKADIVFAVDTSRSMRHTLAAGLENEARKLMQQQLTGIADRKYALLEFRDYNFGAPGPQNPVITHHRLTDGPEVNSDVIANSIGALEAGDGGSPGEPPNPAGFGPEAYNRVFLEASRLQYREGAQRYLVVLGDDVGRDTSGFGGCPVTTVNDPGDDGDGPADLPMAAAIQSLNAANIQMLFLSMPANGSAGANNAFACHKAMAEATGGHAFKFEHATFLAELAGAELRAEASTIKRVELVPEPTCAVQPRLEPAGFDNQAGPVTLTVTGVFSLLPGSGSVTCPVAVNLDGVRHAVVQLTATPPAPAAPAVAAAEPEAATTEPGPVPLARGAPAAF